VGGNSSVKKNAMGQPILEEKPPKILISEQQVGPSNIPKDAMG